VSPIGGKTSTTARDAFGYALDGPLRSRLNRYKNRSKFGRGAATPEFRQPEQSAMEKFIVLNSVAAPLKIINVDTDMIIPKQYLKTIKRTGLGKGLFSEQRYKDDGS